MKLKIIVSLTLVILSVVECGVIKNLVETAADEVNKVADIIENVISKHSGNLTDVNPVERVIQTDKNTSGSDENVVRQTVLTEEIISAGKTSNLSKLNDVKKNSTVLVNVEITLVVNNENQSVSKVVDRETITVSISKSKDKSPDHELPTQNEIIQANTQPNHAVYNMTENVKEENPESGTTAGPTVNANIIFPGPINTSTHENGLIVTETNDNITDINQLLFPDSTRLDIPTSKITFSCPEGLVMTEKGDCLKPINGEENKINAIANNITPIAAFVGSCIGGYARALDGSCQEVIYD